MHLEKITSVNLRGGSAAAFARIYALVLISLILASTTSFAIHSRGSSASYSIAANGVVTLEAFSLWRAGDSERPVFKMFTGPNATGTFLGDFTVASSANPYATGTENIDPVTGALLATPRGYIVRRDVYTFNLSAQPSGVYYARWYSCCRVSGIRNAPEGEISLELRVVYQAGKASSGPTMVPATVDVIGRGFDYVQNLNSTDPDGTPVSYQLITGPAFPTYGPTTNMPGLSLNALGTLAISAQNTANLQFGRWVYKVRVTDGQGATAERDVLVLVQDPFGNLPPRLDPIGTRIVDVGTPLSFTVSGNDPANQQLTLRAQRIPTGAQFAQQAGVNNVASTFSWTPQPGQEGVHYVNFEVYDQASTPLTTSELVQIIVRGPNVAPVLDPVGHKVIVNGSTLTFQLSGSDPDPGQAVTFEAFNLPTGATFDPATGTFTWTPASAQYNTTFTGITLRARDDGTPSLTASESISITVGAGNFPPVLDPLVTPITVLRGQAVQFNVRATDANSAQRLVLSALASSLPIGASFPSSSGNSSVQAAFSWTPSAGQTGTYLVRFRAEDNGNPVLTSEASVTINVVDNSPPASANQNLTLLEDTPTEVTLSGTDADGDPLTFIVVTSPARGTLSGSGSVLTYTPALNYFGSDSFTYKVSDGQAESTVSTISLQITAVNDTPVVQFPLPDFSLVYGDSFNYSVPGNAFTDVESGSGMAYSASGFPVGVTFQAGTRTFSGRPPAGTYNIVVTASDSGSPAASVSDTFTLTVAKAPLVVSAANKSKIYGAALPELTATVVGLVNGDTVANLSLISLFTTASADSPAGQYPIIPSGGTSPNYLTSYEEGVLTVTPAPLVIRADDKTKVYGADLPELTATIEGLVNGDSSASVEPIEVTSTVNNSTDAGLHVGVISATAAGSPNYTITYVPGNFTVTKAPLTATSSGSRQYGQPNPTFVITYTGLLLGQGPEVIDVPPTASTTATIASVVGEYPVTLAGGLDNNYSIQLQDGTLTILPAPLTATITSPASEFLAQVYQNIDFTGTFTKSGVPAIVDGIAGDPFYLGVWEYESASVSGLESATLSDVSVTDGSINDTFHFETPGVYNLRFLLSDAAGTTAEATTVAGQPAFFVVYNPNGEYVTGRGIYNSPAGAFAANTAAEGKALFGFSARYLNGSTVPHGEAEFQLKIANFHFQSTALEWLVVAGARAQFKGTGTVNAAGLFGFILTTVDGQVGIPDGLDRLRLQIWDKTSGAIVYDNQPGSAINDPLDERTIVQGRSIVIHKP